LAASLQFFLEKGANERGDLIDLFVQREVSGVEDMNFRRGYISLVGRCAAEGERRIILAPDHQYRRFILAQPGLPSGISGHVVAIVTASD
jgi:hypothetical protein